MVADFASTSSTPPANGRYSSITVFEVWDRLNQPLRYHCFGSMFGFDLWPGPLSEVRQIIFTLSIMVCCTRPYYKVLISDQQHCSLRFMRPVTLGRWHWGRNAGWGCLRIGCWGEYLGLRGTRWQGSGGSCIMRSLMIYTPRPVLFGWSNREEWDGRGM